MTIAVHSACDFARDNASPTGDCVGIHRGQEKNEIRSTQYTLQTCNHHRAYKKAYRHLNLPVHNGINLLDNIEVNLVLMQPSSVREAATTSVDSEHIAKRAILIVCQGTCVYFTPAFLHGIDEIVPSGSCSLTLDLPCVATTTQINVRRSHGMTK